MITYGRWLGDTLLIILLAYVAKLWAFAHRPVSGALDRLPPDEFAAARASGASVLGAIRTVVLRPLAPALLAAWLVCFLTALHEVTMSSLLYGPGNETLAVVVLNSAELGQVGQRLSFGAADPHAAGAGRPVLVGDPAPRGEAGPQSVIRGHRCRVTPLEVRGLSVSYGATPALVDVDLAVAPGEMLAVLGPSGSGKSTILHTVAGFIAPNAGEVWLGGERVATPRTGHPARGSRDRDGFPELRALAAPECASTPSPTRCAAGGWAGRTPGRRRW